MTFRSFSPLHRFDHHRDADPPATDPSGRRILYVGQDLATSSAEVFGEAGIAPVCPGWRIAIFAPTRPQVMFDLARNGASIAIGGCPP